MNKRKRASYKNMTIIYHLWQAIESAASKPFGSRSPATNHVRFFCALVLFVVLTVASIGAGEKRPNVLLIIVDDLRPEFPVYGVEHVHAPNLQRLANQGVVFENAFCQTPVCGPSRACFMTGLRPEGRRFYSNKDSVDEQVPWATTIPGHFQDHGYVTRAFGKVFHHANDKKDHWTKPRWQPGKTCDGWMHYQTKENIDLVNAPGDQRGRPVEIAPDEASLKDTKLADAAIAEIREQAAAGRPFMLATGFYRPHLPFIAPKKDWDRYPPESIKLPTSGVPKGAEPAAHTWGELRKYHGVPKKGPVTEDEAVELVRGYLACVTHIDRQIGRLLDTLDELNIADNTVVIVYGDHGWFLRDHGMWCKHSTFLDAVRVPLIVRAPGVKPGRSEALVELVDVFPTVSELSGLPIHRQCEGNSFVPVLQDPDRKWKKAVFSRQLHMNAVITKRYAYTEFQGSNKRMCYDRVRDPVETVNLALDPAHAETIKELAAILNAGWRPCRPDNTPAAASLDDMAAMMEVQAKPRMEDGSFPLTLSVRNDKFEMPLTLVVEPRSGHGAGWTVDGLPASCTLKQGESKVLAFSASHRPRSIRYPLPQLRCTWTLALPSAVGRGEPFKATRTLGLPLIGTQPPLPIATAKTAPTIDGQLDEEQWQAAPDVPVLGRLDLTRSVEPVTQVWTAYDADHLYIAFRCNEPQIKKLKAKARKRDDKVYLDDSVEVMFDPAGDAKTYYQIIVNTKGVVFDGQKFNNKINLKNIKVGVLIHDDHWTAEVAMPWKDVGLDGPPANAGILLGRNRQVTGKTEIFQFPVSPKGNHQPGLYARMRFNP